MPTDIIANRYRIVREIARSNDVVYEAIDQSLGRRLAVKELTLPGNLTGQARRERIERFNREARAAGKLQHPNIVTVYNFGESDGRHFIAMEYLEGQTLRDALQARGALPLDEARDIACQVLGALAHAHSHRVVHRDIKPDNIQILPGGQIKLTDFGIARITEEASLTGEGQVFGTPSYMSPEQIEGRFVDQRTDLFSLSVVLYEMLAGRKPFTGDSVVSITYNIMHQDPAALVGVPFGVEQVIFRALSKDPGRRFMSADEMRQALVSADSVPSMFLPRQPTALGGLGNPGSAPAPLGGYAGGFGGGYPPAQAPPSAPLPTPLASLFPGLPAHLGTGGAPYAPPPQPVQSGPQAGPFVSWGTQAPGSPPAGNPVYSPPVPPAFARRRDGPLLSPTAATFMAWLAGGVVFAAVVVGIVLLFLRAYEQQRQRIASEAVNRTIGEGKKLYDSGDLERAAGKFEEAWRAAPGTRAGDDARLSLAVTLNRLGTRSFDAGDLKRAESYWYRTLDIDADNADAHYNLGKLYDRLGNHDRAMEEWQRSSAGGRVGSANPAAPGNNTAMQSRLERARLMFNQGVKLYNGGDLSGARDAWQQALGEAPGTEVALKAQQYLDRTVSAPNF